MKQYVITIERDGSTLYLNGGGDELLTFEKDSFQLYDEASAFRAKCTYASRMQSEGWKFNVIEWIETC